MNESIILSEYESSSLAEDKISKETGKKIKCKYGKYLDINYDVFSNENPWSIKAGNWVGEIPVEYGLSIRILSKVAIKNIFAMWEYAYTFKGTFFSDKISATESLEDLSQNLAGILADIVILRGRRGLYRSYIQYSEEVSAIRGRLHINSMVRRPWHTKPECTYEINTADIEENRILLWTLFIILKLSIVYREDVKKKILTAYHLLSRALTLEPFRPGDCTGLNYNRLNQDYQPAHAICRFFLDNAGPTHKQGEAENIPFLFNLERLFEMFVTAWLKKHLPDEITLKEQEHYHIGIEMRTDFIADLVLTDSKTKEVLTILDTKYKRSSTPEASDIEQVVAYSTAWGCKTAWLVYPSARTKMIDETIGDIRVRSAVFNLDGDLEENGLIFMNAILDDK
jgi:5-methylcytosine-specific restriction enzyme subunit McrC